MVQNDTDTLYHNNSKYYAPFHKYYSSYNGYEGIELSNKFNISTTYSTHIIGLQEGKTCIESYHSSEYYPKTDRFYGELTDYVPTKNGVANIDLKRTAFGLKFIITPPVDGTLSISAYYGINPNIKVSADDNISESSSMYTFSQVYECWQAEKYSEDFTIQLIWERANGATQTFSKTITVKRNVMTTINVNVNGSTTDSSLGVKEDDTPMGNENVDMNFNGGNLDDNEVTPNV